MSGHELTQEQIDDLKASFDMFDKDRSGKVDLKASYNPLVCCARPNWRIWGFYSDRDYYRDIV